jgi:hypothetical protein
MFLAIFLLFFMYTGVYFGVSFSTGNGNIELLFIYLCLIYFLGIFSGLTLYFYHKEMTKYTKTFTDKSSIRDFYLISSFVPLFNIGTIMMYLSNLREISIFNKIKSQGKEYIPQGRRQAIRQFGQG